MGFKKPDNKNSERLEYARAIRNSDETAFAEYYTGFVDSLVNFLVKIVGNTGEAGEIAQEVFIKLWENREMIDPEKALDGFVYTIARNMAFNVIKKRQVHSRYQDEQFFAPKDPELAADEELVSRETELFIRAVIYRMPPQRRTAFEMSRNEGLTYEEIAGRMNLSIDTIKTHIKLALKDIREQLHTLEKI